MVSCPDKSQITLTLGLGFLTVSKSGFHKDAFVDGDAPLKTILIAVVGRPACLACLLAHCIVTLSTTIDSERKSLDVHSSSKHPNNRRSS